jgi:hypothetical protein
VLGAWKTIGSIGAAVLRSFFWMAAVLVSLSIRPSMLPEALISGLLWLASMGVLAPLGIAMLILIPTMQFYWHGPQSAAPAKSLA